MNTRSKTVAQAFSKFYFTCGQTASLWILENLCDVFNEQPY